MFSNILLMSTIFDSVNFNNLDILVPGDHIFRFGAIFKKSLLTHHGIYIGENDVIHFSGGDGNTNLGNSIKEAKITVTSINDFMANQDTCFKMKNDYNDYNITLNRAYSVLDTDFGGYNPANNNCEHFANWCRTGSKISEQSNIISNFSKYIIKKLAISETKIIKVNKLVKNMKNLLDLPIEKNSKITLTNSILDVFSLMIN